MDRSHSQRLEKADLACEVLKPLAGLDRRLKFGRKQAGQGPRNQVVQEPTSAKLGKMSIK